MKREISGLELHYMLKELKFLEEGKLDKIFQPEKNEFLLQFHIPNKGKSVLRVVPGKIIYLTGNKETTGKSHDYCLYLRRHVENARIRAIRQVNFERIVLIELEKETKFRLYIELFGKGNIILCDEKDIILSPFQIQKLKDREIKPKEKYSFPPIKYNLLELTRSQLDEAIKNSGREIVKTLAVDLSLGGLYAEEACFIAKIDKNKKELDKKETDALLEAIKKITDRDSSPAVLFEAGAVKEIVPIQIEKYASLEKKEFPSFNEAIDAYITKEIFSERTEKTDHHAKEIEKLQKIIDMQKKELETAEKTIEENKRKAESIYENYQLVKEVLDELNKAKKKFSWEDIKEKLKSHKTIKEINEKEGKVVIEL